MIQFPVFQSDQKITNLYLTEKIIIFGTPIEFIFGILLYLIEQIIWRDSMNIFWSKTFVDLCLVKIFSIEAYFYSIYLDSDFNQKP